MSIDTNKLTSIELVDAALVVAKDNYCRKAKQFDQLKQAKNDANASYREGMKELKEQMDEEMGAISALEDHKKIVAAAE